MCSWMFNGMGFPMMISGGFMMLLFWGLIIWAVVYIVRKLSYGQLLTTNGHTLKILQERYARGEIQTEEFIEKSKQLK
jgi:putative membrane protein